MSDYIEIIKQLNDNDLVSLICGKTPSYDQMKYSIIRLYGKYTGGFVDRWQWAFYKLLDAPRKDLIAIYEILSGE